MNIYHLEIPDVILLEPRIFEDQRGFFFEAVNVRTLADNNIFFNIVQENCAYSKKAGTIRGLHFQNNPMAQAKIVRCIKGSVLDFAVDLRKDSATYKKHVCAELSADNKKQLYIPCGFAHGVISTLDDTIIEYYADNYYSPENDRTVRYDDPAFGIDWKCSEIIVSNKDMNAPLFSNCDCNF